MFKNVTGSIIATRYNGAIYAPHQHINVIYCINSALKHYKDYKDITIIVDDYNFIYNIDKNSTKNDFIKRLAEYIKIKEGDKND